MKIHKFVMFANKKFKINNWKYRKAIDHCHYTGEYREAACA